MNNKTLLLIAGAAIIFFLLKNKKAKAAVMPANVNTTFEDMPNVSLAAPETVNFQQIVPTPSTVMDIPGISVKYEPNGCGGSGRQLGNLPFVC